MSTSQHLSDHRAGVSRWVGALLLLAAGLLLSGCAHVIRLEHAVQTHAAWDDQRRPTPGDRFAFERSPAQQDAAVSAIQGRLEVQTREWLARWGSTVVNERAQAQWVIQLTWRHQRTWRDPWGNPFFSSPFWGLPGHDVVVTGSGQVVWLPVLHHMPSLHHERELRVQIRDATSNRIVYDSLASQEGPWHDAPVLIQALVEAAFTDFPTAPAGQRQVVIEKPRQPAIRP
jgi:hypothetical protein